MIWSFLGRSLARQEQAKVEPGRPREGCYGSSDKQWWQYHWRDAMDAMDSRRGRAERQPSCGGMCMLGGSQVPSGSVGD
jgi:hypothetical protein